MLNDEKSDNFKVKSIEDIKNENRRNKKVRQMQGRKQVLGLLIVLCLSILIIAGFKLNVIGAAIATVAAQAVSVVLSLVIIRKQKLPFEFHSNFVRLGSEIKAMLVIGTPLALQDCLTNLSFLALCAFVNRLGLDASSGYGVAQKIQSFVMLIPAALMQCMASFVAQNVGAGKEDRAKSSR